ncbi:MAG: protein phosphatase 2C domain-containing protein, partial [Vicinamibacterales bacterium]
VKGLTAIAVADGAGSAPFSKTGAVISVERALRYLRHVSGFLEADPSIWPHAVRGAFEAARGSIADYARAHRSAARDFATTLQVVLLGHAACCYGRVGDGGGVGRVGGALVPLVPAPENGYANETRFLTSPESDPEVFFRADHVSDCAVFTDGIQHLAMQLAQWKPHDPFFTPLFDFVRTTDDTVIAQNSLSELLGTERFDRRTDDDRALVISVWTGDAA